MPSQLFRRIDFHFYKDRNSSTRNRNCNFGNSSRKYSVTNEKRSKTASYSISNHNGDWLLLKKKGKCPKMSRPLFQNMAVIGYLCKKVKIKHNKQTKSSCSHVRPVGWFLHGKVRFLLKRTSCRSNIWLLILSLCMLLAAHEMLSGALQSQLFEELYSWSTGPQCPLFENPRVCFLGHSKNAFSFTFWCFICISMDDALYNRELHLF